MMLSSPLGGGGVQASSLQDQDHLERMRRIEMLLSNVIPGAAEFIAHGLQRNSNSNNSASVDSLQQAGRENHQQQQQHVLSPISPSLTAAGSSVGLSPVQDECCSPIQVESGRRASVFAGQDYIERMKRIELLLGSVQDTNNAAVAQLSVPAVAVDNIAGKKSSDEAKKEPTRKNKAGNKKVARNSDGTIIKRPHVAAGFAGQKPPPKLPQAIAEAAQKKLAGKKKKRAANANANASSASSAASAPAPAVVAVAPATTTVSSVDPARATSTTGTSGSIAPVSWNTATVTTAASAQGAGHAKANTRRPVTLSPTKSFDIPTTIDHDTMGSFTPQQLRQQHHQQQQQQTERNQILARHQQQQRPGRLNTQLRTIPVSYHPHSKQQQQHASYTSLSSPTSASYLQGGLMTNIGSISIPTIPLSNALASYESLVIPASTSVESSPASSPQVKTTTIEIPSSVAPTAASTMLMMEGDREFLGYGPASSVHRGSGGEFSMALSHQDMMAQLASPIDGNGQVLLPFGGPLFHHLQQHQNHHAMHIPQVSCTTTTNNTATMTTAGMTDFASLGMVGMNESLESWMNSQVVPPLDGLIPGLAPPASSVSSHDVATSAAAAPISYLQGLHQHQHQDRAMWMPTLGQSNVSFPLTQGSSFVQPPYVGLGQHQHRASIQHHQHQHQQSFYIPQIQDDDEDEDDGEDAEEETSD
ncbi:hypothetical protein BGX29_010948 [Mortierella sp. GBA35]|nr:hypothetical protein BGX29_010948 [Mortierella sp. GBA35]